MSGMVDSQLAEESLMPFVLLLVGIYSVTASAEQQWFSRHSEGWFWYEQIAEPETDENEANDQTKRHQPHTTAWIRNNIGLYLDKAIELPSRENVSNYLYLDRLIKEKAERFARVGKQVIEGDPLLDENVRRPISPAAAKISDDMVQHARQQVLQQIAKIAGLVFYYQGRCRLCQLQAQTLMALSQHYSFKLISFSTDGELIPDLPDSRIDREPSPTLNIQAYPALFLMKPPDEIIQLRQGVISYIDLHNRIVEAAHEAQWISEQDYKSTLIVRDNWNDASANAIPLAGRKLKKHHSIGEIDHKQSKSALVH
ncbi:conjugal transfer protein TraF [Endozoicomonas sp. SESOKO4]|uniref:conjugal transfer protein TraF n=1 Tax=Endozoicomonas sp. SESOKO4 TaxID=2828745 RepID=UPI0021477D2B|nr:conjugal transfer protein TraF [Endozoicomonas sp. SESOKO4]